MKFLDEKGRLFGKLNVIDFFVILVLVAAIALAGYKVLGGRIASASNVKEVLFTVRCLQKYDYSEAALKKGDVVLSLSKPEDAYIEDFSSVPSRMSAVNDQGEYVEGVHPFLRDVSVTIKTKMDINQNIYKLGSQEVVVGRQYTVKTKDTEMWGYIDQITVVE